MCVSEREMCVHRAVDLLLSVCVCVYVCVHVSVRKCDVRVCMHVYVFLRDCVWHTDSVKYMHYFK